MEPRPDWFEAFSTEWLKGFSVNRSAHAARTVYAISEGIGFPVKIGITADIENRFNSIRSHTWRNLYLCWSAPGASVYEAAIKHILNDNIYRCEWFKDPQDAVKLALRPNSTNAELRAFINGLAARFDLPPRRRDRLSRVPGAGIPILPQFVLFNTGAAL